MTYVNWEIHDIYFQHHILCLYHVSISSFRSSHRRSSVRKGVLRNFAKFTGKHLRQSLCFNKVAGLRKRWLLQKKRLWQRCFPVNFVKFVRTPFLQNTSGRLLLFIYFFATSFIEVIKTRQTNCFWEYNECKTKHLLLIK